MVLQEEVIVAALFLSLLGASVQSYNRQCLSGYCWNVDYTPRSICALRGSSVDLKSSFRFPEGLQLVSTLWHVEWLENEEPINITNIQSYSNRVYHTSGGGSSTLRIRDLRESDSREYRFRILTNDPFNKYTGVPGIKLSVTGLQVTAFTDAVSEGQGVILTCSTNCSLTQHPTYTWHKNGQPVTGRHRATGNDLHLISVSREDSGNYSCAVKGNANLISPSLSINVTYSPKNTSACAYPPGEISEGISVTLVCSSSANPSVYKYTWFRKGGGQRTGQNYTIANISSDHSGEYYCSARNMVGEAFSAPLKINVKYPPRVSTIMLSPYGDVIEGSSMTLTCSSEANPPVHTYVWYKRTRGHSVQMGVGQNYSTPNATHEHSGEYHCQAENLNGLRNSTPVFVDVLYPPKNLSVSVCSSGGSITLVCNSDANPEVQSYTWHRVTEENTSQRGTGRNLTLTSAESAFYYCVAKNKIGPTKSDLIPISEEHSAAIYAVGAAVGTGALIVIAIIVLRMKRFWVTEIKKGQNECEQDDSSPVYVNVSRTAMTSDPEKDGTDTGDDINYTSVYFKHCDRQEVSSHTTLQKPKLTPAEDEILYSTVQFHH